VYRFTGDRAHIADLSAKWVEAATMHIATVAVAPGDQFVSPIQYLWDEVWSHRDCPLAGDDHQTWWDPALTLLLVSDAASENLGFPSKKQNVFNSVHRGVALNLNAPLPTHATLLSPDVACVQPKSRVPKVGCTIRSFSHHLSLLPPRRVAVARWHYLKDQPIPKRASDPLNLLLIRKPPGKAAWRRHRG
jgi:hypothetical protein